MLFQGTASARIQVLFAVLLVSGLSVCTSQTVTCDPYTACNEGVIPPPEPGKKVLDPTDCHKYYVCIENSTGNDLVPSNQPLTCQSTEYFDPSQGDCVEETYSCANPCTNKDCLTNCEGLPDYTLLAYPRNCTKYLLCLPGGDTAVAECPADEPYFDGKVCVSDQYSCCDICNPYCATAYSEVMDPADCTNYYLCLADNYIPDEEDNYSCGNGNYFDPAVGLCAPFTSEITSCYTVCNVTQT